MVDADLNIVYNCNEQMSFEITHGVEGCVSSHQSFSRFSILKILSCNVVIPDKFIVLPTVDDAVVCRAGLSATEHCYDNCEQYTESQYSENDIDNSCKNETNHDSSEPTGCIADDKG